MNVRQMTAKRSTRRGYTVQRMLKAAARSLGELARPTLAAFLAVVVAGGPVWAQDQPQQQPTPAPERPGLPTPQTPAQEVYTAPAKNPPIPVSLGSSKYHYTRAPKPFPSLIAPYRPILIPEPVLTNSPRVDQLIHDGKLELTLQDAVELALENSMDIAVSRYNPWFATPIFCRRKQAASHSASLAPRLGSPLPVFRFLTTTRQSPRKFLMMIDSRR